MKKKLYGGLATGFLVFAMSGIGQAAIMANEDFMTSGVDDTTATAQDLGALSSGGSLIVDGWIDSYNSDDVDFYKFTTSAPTSLFFDIDYAYMSPDWLESELSVFNSSDALLAFNDGSWAWDGSTHDPGSLPGGIWDPLIGPVDLVAGDYFVAVSSYGNDPLTYAANMYLSADPLLTSGWLINGAIPGSDFIGGGWNTGPYVLNIGPYDAYDGAPSEVPEPATMLLFGSGLAGLAGARMRRKKKS